MPNLTFDTPAWVERNHSLSHIIDGTARAIHFAPFTSDMTAAGYVKVGTMRVTVELDELNVLQNAAADTLRAEIKRTRADAENAITELTRKLNEVLAIEMSPAGEEALA